MRLSFYFILMYSMHSYSSDLGVTGLIKTPNARMFQDGDLAGTVSREFVNDTYNITYQATPWLQTTFRYAIFNPRKRANSLDNTRDRSYGAKVRLVKEGRWKPSISLGINDLFGTGIMEAEYFVASKRMRDVDFSLGLGWGRLKGKRFFENPLVLFREEFESRPDDPILGGRYGGESRGASYFRGDASFFGGISYSFSSKPIKLLLEYNSDTYSREVALSAFSKSPSPINFGLQYGSKRGFQIGLSRLHGEAFGITISSILNTRKLPEVKPNRRIFSSMEKRELSEAPSHLNLDSWYDSLLFDAERSGLRIHSGGLHHSGSRLNLEVENEVYQMTSDAIHKVLGLALVHAPSRVGEVRVFLREDGYLGPTVTYSRPKTASSFFAALEKGKLPKEDGSENIIFSPPSETFYRTNRTSYELPKLRLGLDWAARMQLMDPDDPLRYQVYAKSSARLEISKKTDLWFSYGWDLYNNFSRERQSNSQIRRVRSDLNEYLTRGASGIDQLFLEHRGNLKDSIFFRSYIGILEMMYAGVGSELLYSPFGRRFGFGATFNWLKQRGFQKDFAFRDYQTLTGYLSFYYAAPFYNYDFAIHSGRYLGRDRGATFEARRTFDNGFSIGGFFTKTDLSAEEFGEGSFDKGLFFRIPLNSLFRGNTKASYSTILRPLDRDGGRRLEDFSGTLWFARRSLRLDALINNSARMDP